GALVLELVRATVRERGLLQISLAAAVLVQHRRYAANRIGIDDRLAGLVENPFLGATVRRLQFGLAALAVQGEGGELAQRIRLTGDGAAGVIGRAGRQPLGGSGGEVESGAQAAVDARKQPGGAVVGIGDTQRRPAILGDPSTVGVERAGAGVRVGD